MGCTLSRLLMWRFPLPVRQSRRLALPCLALHSAGFALFLDQLSPNPCMRPAAAVPAAQHRWNFVTSGDGADAPHGMVLDRAALLRWLQFEW